ncbi:hypothetical protein [Roseibium sp. MMSF_3412]|uniref:hypothetical protein n=1 Tax=Roseibium sp. MMSF_3412 TaxID=3046712 RepID=UPI00273E5513|nr:hypothetical protein [Roseibium sp. MMSF_3412]
MKLVFLVAAFMLLAVPAASASPQTCVASAPSGNSLRVYDAPTTNGPVLGGIGVGTCGINVTNQCEGTMCVIAFPGLNGWVDMRHISNSPVQAPGLMPSADVLGTYVYGVTGGSGKVTAAGVTQPTPVDATGTVRIEKSSPTSATLVLPREVTDAPVRLSGSGAGPWTGGFGSWGGMPMNVSVRFDGLGNPAANLVLVGQNQIASMEITLNLAVQTLPSASGPSASTPAPAPTVDGAGNPCVDLARITAIINRQASTRQVQDMRGIYVIAGVRSTDATGDTAACRRALDLIAQNDGLWKLAENGGVGSTATGVPVPRPSPKETPASSGTAQTIVPSANAPGISPAAQGTLLAEACVILQPSVSPLLRGASRETRAAVLKILAVQGIVSVASAQPRQCAYVMAELIAAGLIANDNRPWASLAQAGVAPAVQQGEDPATMIAGGAEIGIDPSDFIPEFNPEGQAAPSASPAVAGGAETVAGNPCIELGNAMIVTIRLGFAADIDGFAAILKKHRVETLDPSGARICENALADARQAGLVR